MVKSKLSFFSAWAASLFCFSCLIISGKQFGCSIPCSNHHFLFRTTHPLNNRTLKVSKDTSRDTSRDQFLNFCTKSSMNSAQLMEAKKTLHPGQPWRYFSPSVHLWNLYSLYIWNDVTKVTKDTKCTSPSSGKLWKFHELQQSSFWDVWFAGFAVTHATLYKSKVHWTPFQCNLTFLSVMFPCSIIKIKTKT